MLKTWAKWGALSASKEDHQKRVWSRVLKAQKEGTLPTMEELDRAPVEGYD